MMDYERAPELWFGSCLYDREDEDQAYEKARQKRIDGEPDGDPNKEIKQEESK